MHATDRLELLRRHLDPQLARWIASRLLAPCIVLGLTCAPLRAQGRADYLNVESPQVSPIALATVGTRQILLVCNTPDNSIEIWDTDESILPAGARFLARQRVGLEPVSVHVSGDRFWTANFLGDSVTAGQLLIVNGQVEARILATAEVGDEPMDVAFFSDGGNGTILVSLNTTSALTWLDASRLVPRDPAFPVSPLVEPTGAPPHGLKEPHAVRVFGGRVYALAFKGGVTHSSSTHDLDILSGALPGVLGQPLSFDRSIAKLGSTNFNMRFASNGNLWAVGGEALNFDNETGPDVEAESSGFVQSTLYKIANPGTASPSISRRDINRNCNTPVDGSTPAKYALAMPTDLALYEVGGVVKKVFVAAFSSDRIGVFAEPVGHIACISNPPVPPGVNQLPWTRRTMGYLTPAPVGGNTRWGPRGLALGPNQAGAQRLYVLNRLDNSLSVFDPAAETEIVSVPLQQDPTPAYIRDGREFLYSADISGNKFVSCASCHTDGRTDGLAWKLGNPGHVPPVGDPPQLVDMFRLAGTGVFGTGESGNGVGDPFFFIQMMFPPAGPPTTNPPTFDPVGDDDKREMVTQSLQGLSNFEVAFADLAGQPEQAQLVRTLFHNGPFHWRGDKNTLRDFNEAFVTLLGGVDLNPQGAPVGLLPEEMDRFEDFVHSITYPPNPQQPKSRVFSPDDAVTGFAGGQTGMELFHTLSTLRGRSCVQCHSLPEGSNNRLTVFVSAAPFAGYIGLANRQPIESAAMRGLLQKEPLLEPDGNFPNDASTTPVVGHFGLNHEGILTATSGLNPHTSINLFIDVFFGPGTSPEARAVKQFAHEFDWGMGPTIGQVVFVPQAALSGDITPLLQKVLAMQDQVKAANASLVVWGEFPNQVPSRRGWRYYPIGGGAYVEEPSLTFYTLGQIRNFLLAPEDSVTFLTVPLGGERRISAPTGAAGSYPQLTPTDVSLEPMVPNTAYAVVPTLRNNWVPEDAPPAILGGALPFDFFEPDGMDDVFTKAVRLFQYGLLDGQNTLNYGVSSLRHEAPRRLRVRGTSIVTGAKLLISVPYPTLPYSGPPPSDPAGQASIPTLTLELPIYPTDDAVGEQPVWETAVELDPIWAYVLMLGGPRAPNVTDITHSHSAVQDVIDFTICSELPVFGSITTFCNNFGLPNPNPVFEPTATFPTFTSPFDPDHWNWFKVQVRNPGPGGPTDPSGPPSTAVWQQLKM
jgi:hypothetical protein